MIVFFTLCLFALNSCSCTILAAHETLVFEALLFDVLDTLHADHSVLFLEVALRHPDCADIVDPDIVASGLV